MYAGAKGWRVAEVYRLEGVSGKAVSDQPETKRMLADIQRGHIEALIFSKLARLARNTRELLDFADTFQRYGADLVSLQESIDTSTPAGRLFYTMIAAMAQWEREEITDRLRASLPVRAKLGKHIGGQLPFGYRWQDGEVVPDPAEAPVRKLMYELFQTHRRKKTVCRILNESGYRTRAGARWTDHTLHRLLQDATAKGLRRAYHTATTEEGKWDLKPESEWVWLPVEPIVSEDLWENCNRILAERHRKLRPAGPKPVHLFAGLAVCHCGQKMYVPSNTPKYVCQKCRNKIPIEDLEAIYYEQLKSFYLSPGDLETYLAEVDETIRDKQQLLAVLTAEEQKLRQEMDQVYRLYIDETISSQGFGERYRPLEERLAQINEELPILHAELDIIRVNLLSSDEIFHEAQDLSSRWPHLSHDERRAIVEHITDQIIVGQGDITIHLSYLPFPGEMMAKGPPGRETAPQRVRGG